MRYPKKLSEALRRSCARGRVLLLDNLMEEFACTSEQVHAAIRHVEKEGFYPDVIGATSKSKVSKLLEGVSRMAVISDTHFGSRHCMREELHDFIVAAYECGVRVVLHAGDVLDGNAQFVLPEQSHYGIDAQAKDAITWLPELEGLTYHFITGNHDEWYRRGTGLDPGDYLVNKARERGREDIHCVGRMAGRVEVGNAKVDLWHPSGGQTYAVSYKLQKKIESYEPGGKPDFLFCGHLHQAAYVRIRGVHAFHAGCWQAGNSPFANSLTGSPSIGGWVVSWKNAENGTIRRVNFGEGCYYHGENEA